MMDSAGAKEGSLRAKAASELRELVVLTVYLWLCFGAVIFLKDAILEAHGIAALPLGFAAIKAVVCAKFVMIGRLLPVAARRTGERFVVAILRRSLALLVILIALTLVEHIVLAMIHGQPLAEAMASLGGGTAYQMAATIAIMLLILVPYVAFHALDEALGKGTMRRLLLERQRPPR
jgi:hypothetical protein